MQLKRVKSDAADAKGIAAYGKLMELKPWQPLKEGYLKIKQWYTVRKQLLKHLHATTQQIEAFLAAGKLDKNIKATLEDEIDRSGPPLRDLSL